MQDIEYKIQQASYADVERHLNEVHMVRSTFPLNVQDISKYAKKLTTKSTTYEAWSEEQLIGLVAVYFNDAIAEAFVSNVSVSPVFLRKKLASALMRNLISDAQSRKIRKINLLYDETNISARNLYQKFGFTVVEKLHGEIQMTLIIGDND